MPPRVTTYTVRGAGRQPPSSAGSHSSLNFIDTQLKTLTPSLLPAPLKTAEVLNWINTYPIFKQQVGARLITSGVSAGIYMGGSEGIQELRKK